MKKRRILCMALSALLLGVVGCKDEEHVHEYQYYTVKQATCTEEGVMEKLCTVCGEKEYLEIMSTGHTMIDGVCSICGEGKTTPTETPSVTDYSAFYTVEDLYEKVNSLKFGMEKEEFFNILRNNTFSDIYINGLGHLKLTTANGFVLNLGDIRKEFPIETDVTTNVYKIGIHNGIANLIHGNGTYEEIGRLEGLTNFFNTAMGVVGFTVNKQNQLLVRYKNDVVYPLGKISEQPLETSDSALIYKVSENGYVIFGIMDQGAEAVTIPYTHLGKPIERIAPEAFSMCANLKKVTFSEGVSNISGYAFAECTALEEVEIPVSVNQIAYGAFENCSRLQKVTYGGTTAQWETLMRSIGAGNEYLLVAQVVCNG